jgi:hypothetical protein
MRGQQTFKVQVALPHDVMTRLVMLNVVYAHTATKSAAVAVQHHQRFERLLQSKQQPFASTPSSTVLDVRTAQ